MRMRNEKLELRNAGERRAAPAERAEKREWRDKGGERRDRKSFAPRNDRNDRNDRDGGGKRFNSAPRSPKPAEKMDARSVAFEALSEFLIKGNDIEAAVDRLFDKKDFITKLPLISPTEKRLAYEIIYGVLRNKSRLEFAVDKYLAEPVQKEEWLKIILIIGAYQILFLTKIPDFAAVNESVNLCKKHAKTGKFSDLTNAVLRKLIADKKTALEIPSKLSFAEKIALEYSHPLWLVEKWIGQFGKTPTQKILEYNNKMPDIFIRRNSSSIGQKKFEAMIAKNCANNVAKPIGFNGLYYRLKAGERFEKSDMFLSGLCTIQAPSSGWVVALLGVENGKSVLDLCAAPGGKTTLISEISPDSHILAADINFNRARMISDTLKRLLLKSVDVVVSDGKNFAPTQKFDYVLIDAPCSGTGVINHNPEARWVRDMSAIERAAQKQKEILQNAANLVDVGGIIVYSTCSLENEENRGVVEAFLAANPNFKLSPANSKITDKDILSSNGDFVEITPNKNNADTIFAARFERVG